jgi:hypothetical protein
MSYRPKPPAAAVQIHGFVGGWEGLVVAYEAPAARGDHHPGHEQGMTSTGTWTIRAPGLLVGLASLDSLLLPGVLHLPGEPRTVRIVRRFRPAPTRCRA